MDKITIERFGLIARTYRQCEPLDTWDGYIGDEWFGFASIESGVRVRHLFPVRGVAHVTITDEPEAETDASRDGVTDAPLHFTTSGHLAATSGRPWTDPYVTSRGEVAMVNATMATGPTAGHVTFDVGRHA